MTRIQALDLFNLNEIRINKLVSKCYFIACFVPLIILIMTKLGLYNFPLRRAVIGFVYSVVLCIVYFILTKGSTSRKFFKYFATITMQIIIFIYSTDIDISITIMYMAVPLFALLYFDPILELVACILSIISMWIGIVIMAPEAEIQLYFPVTKGMFILTTGGAHFMEMIAASVILLCATLLARKMMVLLKTRSDKIANMQSDLVFGFADMIESRDGTTGEHVKRTSKTVGHIIDYIRAHPESYANKLSNKEMDLIALAAPLHDIGKMKVPDAILSKPGKLTDSEFEIIKTHPIEGAKIIDKTITNIEDPLYVKIAREMALSHHEKWEGTGYPQGLAGENIPVAARIMAVADVFDALCSSRSYKKAFPIDDAYKIMIDSKDKHFEGVLVDILLELRPQMEAIYGTAE